MSEHNFNRDRNRPYAEDYQDEYHEPDYGPRGRSERDFDYSGGYGRHGMNRYGGGGGFGRSGGMGGSRFQRGYGGPRDFDNDYDSDQGNNFPQRYDRWTQGGYARQMDRQGMGQGHGYDRGGFSGYAREDFGGYGRGYGQQSGMGRQRGHAMGHDYGRGYGRGYGESGFDSGYGRRGMSRYGGDYDMEINDFDYEVYEMEPEVWSYEEVWMIPGPFSGVGPEGYQRSDERIREDLLERLTQHGQLNARNLKADVNNCEVTLSGTVESRQAKRMAEEVAESVFGVKDIHNQIRVQERQHGQDRQHQQERQPLQERQSTASGQPFGQAAQPGQQAGRERQGGENDRS